MNDFTKEELIDILETYNYLDESEDEEGASKLELQVMKKIQSMIDDYCEHSKLDTNICYKCGHGL